MTFTHVVRLGSLALLIAAGFDRAAPFTPSAPTPTPLPVSTVPTPPAATPRVNGEIRLAAVTHASGSTLAAHECQVDGTLVARPICNEEWRGAFDIVVDHDVSDATLTITFEHATGRCAAIYVGNQSFLAGRERLVSTSSPVSLTYIPEDNASAVPYCDLPRTTQKLVAQLWARGNSAAPLLRREFDYTATFTAEWSGGSVGRVGSSR